MKWEERRFLSGPCFASYFLAAEVGTGSDLVLSMASSALLRPNRFSFWGFFSLFVRLPFYPLFKDED